MTRTKSKATPRPPEANDELNEQFHTLLREAAEKREERALVQATATAAAAKQESADLLALARSQSVLRSTAER
ncbi:MAG TPA: hypothetical protein VF344_06370 [Candidatus Limnocylindrales bacterium]|jgi:hypothetical protein